MFAYEIRGGEGGGTWPVNVFSRRPCLLACNGFRVSGTPYALHPAPCTLHPAPYALDPLLAREGFEISGMRVRVSGIGVRVEG